MRGIFGDRGLLSGKKAEPAESISGFLKKKNRKHGILGSNWNKRWFSLSNGILTYAKSKKELTNGGEIQVFAIRELEYIRKRTERLEIEAKFPERVLTVQASTLDEFKRWYAALESARAGSGSANAEPMSPMASRAQQHSPTSPLDIREHPAVQGDRPHSGVDLRGYTKDLARDRDGPMSQDSSPQKRKPSPRSLLANPSNGRTCFGQFFDDLEAKLETERESSSTRSSFMGEVQETMVEDFSLAFDDTPAKAPRGSSASAAAQKSPNIVLEIGANRDVEVSDGDWLENEWDSDEGDMGGQGRGLGAVGCAGPPACVSQDSRDSFGIEAKRPLRKAFGTPKTPGGSVKTQEGSDPFPKRPGGALDFNSTHVFECVGPDDGWLVDDWDSD